MQTPYQGVHAHTGKHITLVGSGIWDTQELVMQNVKLVEGARLIGKWRKASTMEDVNAINMNNRITVRNIFGQVGGTIGDQALAML